MSIKTISYQDLSCADVWTHFVQFSWCCAVPPGQKLHFWKETTQSTIKFSTELLHHLNPPQLVEPKCPRPGGAVAQQGGSDQGSDSRCRGVQIQVAIVQSVHCITDTMSWHHYCWHPCVWFTWIWKALQCSRSLLKPELQVRLRQSSWSAYHLLAKCILPLPEF